MMGQILGDSSPQKGYCSSMDNALDVYQPVPSGRLKGLIFDILSAEDAGKISTTIIESGSDISDPALGLPFPAEECPTCGAKKRGDCEGHFGLINLPFTILNPYFLTEVAQILNKICPGCKSVRHDKIKKAGSASRQPIKCRYCDGRLRDRYPRMKFRISSREIFSKTAIIAEPTKSMHLAPDYWNFIPQDTCQGDNSLEPHRRVLSHAQVYSILKDVSLRFLEGLLKRKNSIFLSCLLVTPNSHRVREFGHRISFDETTRLYKKLVDFRGTANELSVRVVDRFKISKIRAEKLSTTQQIYSEKKSNNDAATTSGLRHVKELLLGKRTDHTVRTVVVGDPRVKVTEIGVPVNIAESVLILDHLNLWNWNKLEPLVDFTIIDKGEMSILRKGERCSVRSKDLLQVGDAIYRPLIEGDMILINRPPSIHQHSIIALSVKILPVNFVLSINPLVCSPLRGDFDGDCLHGYVPQSVDSKVELKELVALNKQLTDGQSGSNLLSLSHDSLTAGHLILEDGVFMNKFEMQQLQMFSPHRHHFELPTVVKGPSSSNGLWTGKQLVSLFLPSDFEFVYPHNSTCISKGELMVSSKSSWLRDTDGNLFDCLIKHCGEEALDFLNAAQEILCEWLSMRGLSVSLSDLCLSSDPFSRENLLEEVSLGLQEAERQSHIRLLMVDNNEAFLAHGSKVNEKFFKTGKEQMSILQQKSAILSQASISAFRRVFSDIQSMVYQYASSDNSLLAMLKAGSKGNMLKLVQHSMCLGLQHSLVPLSFRIPHDLSCAAWNNHKTSSTVHEVHGTRKHSDSYVPCTVVENSFIGGLNPLECFVHALTTRDSSFSGHADVSGTLTRRLMFFMRDLTVGYDGTVRNAYGNQVVQFSYCTEEIPAIPNDVSEVSNKGACFSDPVGGHPVGSLAACAISEAAYSALDQPVSALESSPLLNLKKVLECGVKNRTGDKSASLFLSQQLGRWAYGFEYGALEIKNYLERLLFADIVSKVMICYSPKTQSKIKPSSWVCHFHINMEVVNRRRLKLQSVIHALNMNCNYIRVKTKISFPKLQILSKSCSESNMQNQADSGSCITVAVIESSKDARVVLETLQDVVIPVLLRTVVKGFLEFNKVDVLWKDHPSQSKFSKRSSGELFVRVYMSKQCDRTKFWRILKDNCLQIRNLIDWDRSHPDDMHDLSQSYGIDVAWNYFLNNLNSAIQDTGKSILPQHLLVAASCMSATGEFVPLNAKGLAQQRKGASISSPFTQACFSNPSDSFVKAAKMGQVDYLRGSIDALSWGQTPSIGTGCQFDIIYAKKEHEIANPVDVYSLLKCHVNSPKLNESIKLPVTNKEMSSKWFAQSLYLYGTKNLLRQSFFRIFCVDEIMRILRDLKRMLHGYSIDRQLSGQDKSTAMKALRFHPRWKEKIGSGVKEIKVGAHPKHENSRCFLVVRTDETVEDFSYHKCVHNALEVLAPKKAQAFRSRWLNGTTKT